MTYFWSLWAPAGDERTIRFLFSELALLASNVEIKQLGGGNEDVQE